MSTSPRPISLVAERAVRFLRDQQEPVDSVELARHLLSTRIRDEDAARKILESAFASDPRLEYVDGGWRRTFVSPAEAGGEAAHERRETPIREPVEEDPDCVLITIEGGREARGRPFQLTRVAAVRLHRGEVAAACGGDVSPGGDRLRRVFVETLDGAVPVVHDPPGSLPALERWLDEPLAPPISLRRLAQARLGLPARHDLDTLLGRLGINYHETDDPLVIADTLHACIEALRRPGESLAEMCEHSAGGSTPIDWSRLAFDRSFLRNLPHTPGTYEFYDSDGVLLYTGKARNLHQRVGSYFREGPGRSTRVQRLLDKLHRIEIQPSGSDLEAMLREAAQIRENRPTENKQRKIHPRAARAARLRSILILEPATAPWVLRAYLLRDGRLLDKVGIGPRGGGLKRIERILDDHFFSMPVGPTTSAGPDVDVEMVGRWLAANRGRVVAFDPTDLPSAREVTDRLRWFLGQGAPFDPDGTPILNR
jgi:hypothetical protein